MLYATEVEDLINNSNLHTTLRAISNDKVNGDQMSLTVPKDIESRVMKAVNSATRKGAEMALAGLGQAGKQAFPVMADAMGRGIFNPIKTAKASRSEERRVGKE